MGKQEKLVALLSPWVKLSEIVKDGFRVESVPAQKKVMVWREDLQDEQGLADALKKLGIASPEIGVQRVTFKWQNRG